ncbi:MauE/DoxX family redox-associated membrane protein [Nocardia sp. NPDC049149]|uniref:MauE/DoxX family redox-associated membrane protein n=1 Tax=Nocardia sp. NPDC049149 TaxID=3364315 RepID=UPI0037215216
MIACGVWIARLAVAVVFGWAAFAKWADRGGTRQAVEEFGVPTRWVATVAWTLPATELAVAVAVLPSWTAVWGGVAALILLGSFSIAVAVLLARGRRPACSCFGAANTAPIGSATLIRNAGIAALTGLAIWGSLVNDAVPQSIPADRAVGLAAMAAVAVLLWYQQLELRRLRRRVDEGLAGRTATDGLAIGVPAPAFELSDTDGERHNLGKALAAGRPVLLLFLHPGCTPCATIAAELPRWRQRLDGAATVMVIGNDDPVATAEWAHEHNVASMLALEDTALITRYRLRGAPSAVLIDARGRIASSTRTGSYAIRELVDGIPVR